MERAEPLKYVFFFKVRWSDFWVSRDNFREDQKSSKIWSALLIHKMMSPPFHIVFPWCGFKNFGIIGEKGYNSWGGAVCPARRGVLETGGILVIQWNNATEGETPWGGSRRELVGQFGQSFGCRKESNEGWGAEGPCLPFSPLLSLPFMHPLAKLRLVRDQVWEVAVRL